VSAVREPLAVAGIAGVAAVAIAFVLWAAGCGPVLGPEERAHIADTAAKISTCQAAGHACKADGGKDCYDTVYARCMVDAGLK
jgi:hypothetical protein